MFVALCLSLFVLNSGGNHGMVQVVSFYAEISFCARLKLCSVVWSSDREAKGLCTRAGSREDYWCYRFHRRTHVPHEMVCMLLKLEHHWWITHNVSHCAKWKSAESVFVFVQEKLGWSRLGAGEGGQRQVSAGGHLVLRGETYLALISDWRREKRRQKLRGAAGKKKL